MFDRRIVTVWSAPNYCYRWVYGVLLNEPKDSSARGRCGNVASILELNEDLRQEYKVFDHAPQVRLNRLMRVDCSNLALTAGRQGYPGKATSARIFPLATSQPFLGTHFFDFLFFHSFVAHQLARILFIAYAQVLYVVQRNQRDPVLYPGRVVNSCSSPRAALMVRPKSLLKLLRAIRRSASLIRDIDDCGNLSCGGSWTSSLWDLSWYASSMASNSSAS